MGVKLANDLRMYFEDTNAIFDEVPSSNEKVVIEWKAVAGVRLEDIVEDFGTSCGCTADVKWGNGKVTARYTNTEATSGVVNKVVYLYFKDGIEKRKNNRGVMTWPSEKASIALRFSGRVKV